MDKKVPVYNPLLSDFSYEWLDDGNIRHTLTVPAHDIAYFTEPQSKFMAKHLADEVYNKQDKKTNSEDDLKAILATILI